MRALHNKLVFAIFNSEGENVTQQVHDAFEQLIYMTNVDDYAEEYRLAQGVPNPNAKSFLRLTSGDTIYPQDDLYLSSIPFERSNVSAEIPENDPRNYTHQVIYHLVWNEILNPRSLTNTMFFGFFDAETFDASLLGYIAANVDDFPQIAEFHICA